MSQSARIVVGGIVFVLVVVLAALVYIWVSGGSSAPSATLSAPTLAIATQRATTLPTQAPATAATAEATDGSAATEAAPATTEATAQSIAANPGDLVVFNLVADDSEVRFILNEVLRGSPNTVTGRTNQIAGQIAVDFANPAASQVGEIRIDARTLATDNELRNRAIRGQILQSSQDQYEFISFKPTEVTGLPAAVTMGQAFEFQITGDLTIRDITKPVTFDVTVTPDSESKLEGLATATVHRGDFGLTIPNVPGVADVDEDVRLEITFVAQAAS